MKNQKILIAALTLVAFLLLIYWNHFDNAFQFDDAHTIVNNSYIRDIKNIPLFFKDATTFSSLPFNQSYRPIVSTSLAIDYWLAGELNPVYFHASNFILYLLQGVLMFYLFRIIIRKVTDHDWTDWFAFFITAWYMVHTVNAETINYVISRSDTQSTLAVVGAMLIYAANGWGKRYFLYIIPLVLGILAKPTTVMFVPIVFMYMLLFEAEVSVPKFYKAFSSPKLKKLILHFGVIAITCVSGYWFMDHKTPDTWTPGGNSSIDYLKTQPYVMFHYFKMFFLPTELTADTDLEVFKSIADPRFWLGIAFVLGMVAIAIYTSTKQILRPISFGIAWFFLALIPTSSIIPLAEVMNDHRMFFPFVGLVLSVGWGICLLVMKYVSKTEPSKALGVIALCVLVLAAHGYGTYQRNEVWDSNESLWKDVTIKSPNNGRGWMNYGLALMRRGEFTGALEAYNKAMELTPTYAYLHINMGVLLNAMGKAKEAEQYYINAKNYSPNLPEAHYFYASYLFQQKRLNDAIVELKRTIQLSPAHQEARYLLMTVLQQKGQKAELKELAQETLQIIPNDERTRQFLEGTAGVGTVVEEAEKRAKANPTVDNYIELSLTYYNAGNYESCIAACRKALELQSDNAKAYNNICSAYNMLQEWQKAIEACEKAINIEPNFQLAKNNLNWAKSELEKLD